MTEGRVYPGPNMGWNHVNYYCTYTLLSRTYPGPNMGLNHVNYNVLLYVFSIITDISRAWTTSTFTVRIICYIWSNLDYITVRVFCRHGYIQGIEITSSIAIRIFCSHGYIQGVTWAETRQIRMYTNCTLFSVKGLTWAWITATVYILLLSRVGLPFTLNASVYVVRLSISHA